MLSKSYALTFPSNGLLTANRESSPVDVRYSFGFSVHLKVTGTPTGTFRLQATNDDPSAGTPEWVNLASTDVAAVGAPLATLYNVSDAFYGWYRVIYLFSSGTGSVSAKHLDKRI